MKLKRKWIGLALGLGLLCLAGPVWWAAAEGLPAPALSYPAAPIVDAADARVELSRGWDAVFARKSGWVGGDVAASLPIPGNRMLWVFGDSWIGRADGKRRTPSALVNNSIAVHPWDPARPSRPPRSGQVTFSWGPPDAEGKPTPWLPATGGKWFWPTGGAVVLPGPGGDRLVIFLLELMRKPGDNTLWCFDCTGSALAVVDNVAGPVAEWRPRVVGLPHEPSPGVEADWGVEALYLPDPDPPGWVYIYGTVSMAEGRRDLVLARTGPAGIDDFESWQFHADGEWLPGPAQARPVARDVSSELSVDRVQGGGSAARYVMVMSEPALGDRIVVRFAANLAGPWTELRAVYRAPEVQGRPSLFAYAAKGHAALSPPGGLMISYVVNSHDFGEMAKNAEIYRPRMITVRMPELAGPEN